MTLIAFHSRGQRAGKDTAGRIVSVWCAERDLTYRRDAFADRMKMLCALALGHGAADEQDWEMAIDAMNALKLHGCVGWNAMSPEHTHRPYLSGRDFIINVGEGCRTLFGQNFWTDLVLPPVQTHGLVPDPPGDQDVLVFTDLRFDPEAIRVHEYGGHVVEIVRPDAQNIGGRSETGIDPQYIDYTINNNGSLEQFAHALRTLMGYLGSDGK